MSALSEVGGVVAFIAAVAFVAAVINRKAIRDWHNREPVRLDTLDGIRQADNADDMFHGVFTPLCHSTGPRGGHHYVAAHTGTAWECVRCGDLIPRASTVREVTDRDVREVMDEARRITREAASGGAA